MTSVLKKKIGKVTNKIDDDSRAKHDIKLTRQKENKEKN